MRLLITQEMFTLDQPCDLHFKGLTYDPVNRTVMNQSTMQLARIGETLEIDTGHCPLIQIYLPQTIRGDVPFSQDTEALAGIHGASLNQYGAVCVTATNGKELGIKPDEFVWVSGKPDGWSERLEADRLRHVLEKEIEECY